MLNSKEGNSIYVKSKRYSKNNSNGPLFNIQYDQETPAYILLISRIINSNIYKIILFIFTVLFIIILRYIHYLEKILGYGFFLSL